MTTSQNEFHIEWPEDLAELTSPDKPHPDGAALHPGQTGRASHDSQPNGRRPGHRQLNQRRRRQLADGRHPWPYEQRHVPAPAAASLDRVGGSDRDRRPEHLADRPAAGNAVRAWVGAGLVAGVGAAAGWITRRMQQLAGTANHDALSPNRTAGAGLGLGNRAVADHFADTLPTGDGGHGLGALFSALDWDSVRGEVDRESRARIAVIGAPNAGKSTLIDYLKGSPVTGASEVPTSPPDGTRVEDLGLFSMIDLDPTADSPHSAALPSASTNGLPAWDAIQTADLALWLVDGETGLRAWEHEWICRIRAAGKPLLVALTKLDLPQAGERVDALERALACPVVGISARDGTHVLTELLPAMVDACPNLNTALGRETPAWRHAATARVIRRAALLSGLLGLEPVPLLDMPFQALIQMRLVLRVAAIYDQPHTDRYSRELVATLVSGVALRYAAQQLAKVVPIAGWLLSGALAAAGAWVIGLAAEQYFAHGRRVPRPELKWSLRRRGRDRAHEAKP